MSSKPIRSIAIYPDEPRDANLPLPVNQTSYKNDIISIQALKQGLPSVENMKGLEELMTERDHRHNPLTSHAGGMAPSSKKATTHTKAESDILNAGHKGNDDLGELSSGGDKPKARVPSEALETPDRKESLEEDIISDDSQAVIGSRSSRDSSAVESYWNPEKFMQRRVLGEARKRFARLDYMSQEDLKDMFGPTASITAFVIRGKEYQQIPCSGQFSMRKGQMSKLWSSGSISWKDFAFLQPDEVSTLAQIIEGDEGYAKALVQLKRIRKENLRFWSNSGQTLVAIIYSEKNVLQGNTSRQSDRDSDDSSSYTP
jgi:hypothetical protein